MRIGKNMRAALVFAKKYPGWQTFNNDRATKKAILKLNELGLIQLNEFNQFKAI